jgi:alpha-glucosidase
MWWRDAVVYQIYPRSFQDSDDDGVGDLRGVEQRLDYLVWLGVDAFWLSPIYPSPLADFGYDVSNYVDVDRVFGSLDDFDGLVGAAHKRGLRVLLDLVPSHTSIEHPWFREHPDWYIWSPADGPPNNWRAAFGGSAWSRDERSGRWYLHTFYPEQPDLDWRNPDVVKAMQEVVRFWLDRGVDGFRVDAVNVMVKDAELRDDPPASGGFPLPLLGENADLDHVYSGNRPEVLDALAALREAAGGALLVGEVYLPTPEYERYLQALDLVFAFELLHAPWDALALRAAIGPAAALERVAWVIANHDFDRLATRVGNENLRAAAVLLLTLPGAAFVYQGDEIGLGNGPGAEPPFDRAGRDAMRHPMQWEASAGAGFSEGRPWLAPIDPQERNVETQRGDPGSLLALYRRLIALRGSLGRGFRLLDSEPGVVAYERGEHIVAVNTSAEPRLAPAGELVFTTHESAELPPHSAVIVRN